MTAFPAASASTGTRPHRIRQVVVADPEKMRHGPLLQRLADLASISVTRVGTRPELESTIRRSGVDLVVATARLGPDSALEVLARLRAIGDRTPFIVYSDLQASLMRVLVSDARSTLLSSRVMSLPDLVVMVSALSNHGDGVPG